MSAVKSPLRALREVAEQLAVSRAEALQMAVTGELRVLVFTGTDALVTEGSVAEFIAAHRYDPKGDR